MVARNMAQDWENEQDRENDQDLEIGQDLESDMEEIRLTGSPRVPPRHIRRAPTNREKTETQKTIARLPKSVHNSAWVLLWVPS